MPYASSSKILATCQPSAAGGGQPPDLPIAIRPRPHVDRLLISSACSCVMGVSFAFSRLTALTRFNCSSSSGLGRPLVLLSPLVVRPGNPPQYNARIFPRAAARVLTILKSAPLDLHIAGTIARKLALWITAAQGDKGHSRANYVIGSKQKRSEISIS